MLTDLKRGRTEYIYLLTPLIARVNPSTWMPAWSCCEKLVSSLLLRLRMRGLALENLSQHQSSQSQHYWYDLGSLFKRYFLDFMKSTYKSAAVIAANGCCDGFIMKIYNIW